MTAAHFYTLVTTWATTLQRLIPVIVLLVITILLAWQRIMREIQAVKDSIAQSQERVTGRINEVDNRINGHLDSISSHDRTLQ